MPEVTSQVVSSRSYPTNYFLEMMASWLVMAQWSNSFLVVYPELSPSA